MLARDIVHPYRPKFKIISGDNYSDAGGAALNMLPDFAAVNGAKMTLRPPVPRNRLMPCLCERNQVSMYPLSPSLYFYRALSAVNFSTRFLC